MQCREVHFDWLATFARELRDSETLSRQLGFHEDADFTRELADAIERDCFTSIRLATKRIMRESLSMWVTLP